MRFVKVGATCPKCGKLVLKDEEWIKSHPIASAKCPDCKCKIMVPRVEPIPHPEKIANGTGNSTP